MAGRHGNTGSGQKFEHLIVAKLIFTKLTKNILHVKKYLIRTFVRSMFELLSIQTRVPVPGRLIEGLLDERLEDNVLHCPQDILHQVGVRGGRVETICHASLTSVMGQEFLFQKVSKIINASQQIVSHRTSEYLR